jgi:hypothetical protein
MARNERLSFSGLLERLRGLTTRSEVFLVIFMALAGTLIVLFNTRLGAYWSDDTYYYIQPAREFMIGNGFHPSYIFGPVLPFILSLLGLLNLDPLISVRWLNAILFGVNLYLMAHIIRKITGSPAFAIAGSAIILFSDVVIEIHGWAMSEALSITFMLVGISATLSFIKSRSWWVGVLVVTATALAVLTRFAMLPLIPAVSLTLLLFQKDRPFLRRLVDALLMGIASLIPLLLYLLRNLTVSGHPVRYEQFILIPFDKSQLTWLIYNWFSLFIPGRFLRGHEIMAGLLIILVFIFLLFGAYRIVRGRQSTTTTPLFRPGVCLLGSLIVISLIMLYFARGLTELYIYNSRYLIPIFMVFIILITTTMFWIWRVAGRSLRIVMVVLFGFFLAYYVYRMVDFTRHTSSRGLGYSNIGWHESETIRYLQAHPDLTDMVSTGEMGIYFWIGRMPTVLAAFPTTESLKGYLCSHNAPLFIMNQMPAEMYGLSHQEVVEDLFLMHTFNDAEMYVCPKNQ